MSVFDALAVNGRRGQEEDQGAGNYYVTDPVEARNFERFVGMIAGRYRVLVVGCGDGLETELLCERGYWVRAFDLSSNMVTATGLQLEKRELHALLSVDDVTAMALDTYGTYDGVMFAQTGQLIESDTLFRKAIEDLTSLLAPGGVLYVSTTFYDHPRYERTWTLDGRDVGSTTYFRRTLEDMLPVIEGCGLVVHHTEHFDSRLTLPGETYQNDYVIAAKSNGGSEG